MVGATALVTGVVLALVGTADALGIAFGNEGWAGKMVVGLTLIVGTGIAANLFTNRKSRAALRRTVRKYESQHAG
jgi:hypothetical protein